MKKIIYSEETKQECTDLINKCSYNIKYIINPSEEIQKLAVQKNGYIIQFINNPSEEIQKLAVKQNGIVIAYIKNPSEEIQKLAVQQSGHVIKCIINPLEEIQKLAILDCILHNDLYNLDTNKFCPDIDKQWIKEQIVIRNILK